MKLGNPGRILRVYPYKFTKDMPDKSELGQGKETIRHAYHRSDLAVEGEVSSLRIGPDS